MKKTISYILIIAIMLITQIGAFAEIDFSSMSFDELMQAQEQLTSALWNSDGWEDVTIPCGVYVIGSDIPAGRWTITASKGVSYVYTGRQLDGTGNQLEAPYEYEFVSLTDTDWPPSVTWNLSEGAYFLVENSPAVLNTASSGSLGFGVKEESKSEEEDSSEIITQMKEQLEELTAENGRLKEQLSSSQSANGKTDGTIEDTGTEEEQTDSNDKDSTNNETSNYTILTKGDRGEDVVKLQERLKELGFYSIAVDGDYGNGTVNAIKAFEEYNGIEQTGVASPELQALIFSDDAKGIVIPDVEITSLGLRKSYGNYYARPTFVNHTEHPIDGITCMIKGYNSYGERVIYDKLSLNDIKRHENSDDNYLEYSTFDIANIKIKAGGKYQLVYSNELYLNFDSKALSTAYMAVTRYHTEDGGYVEIPENEQLWYGSDDKIVSVAYENNQEPIIELTNEIAENAEGRDLGFSAYFISNFFAEVAGIPMGGVYIDNINTAAECR